MRAAWMAATWRASNSDRVTMSPFTRATALSTISAPATLATSRLATIGFHDFMIHPGPGHEVPDECADGLVRLLAEQRGPRGFAALLHRGLAGGRPLLDAQDVEPERALHDLARLAALEGEGGPLQL